MDALTDRPTITGYELLELIDAGAQGRVYRARKAGIERDVAVKVLFNDRFLAKDALLAQEIDFLAKLEHPNIVRLYDAGTVEGRPWLAMQFVEGMLLDEWIERHAPTDGRGYYDIRRWIPMFLQICDAVEFAHAHGVLHRDLKPRNIIVDAAGRPYVTDFGLGLLVQDSASIKGEFKGTPVYASFQHLLGSTPTVGDDIFSLGVILYEFCCGVRPWVGDLPGSAIVPPQAYHRGLHPDLAAILVRALAEDESDRYPSVAAFADDLRAFLKGREVSARPLSVAGKGGRIVATHWKPVLATVVLSLLAGSWAVVVQRDYQDLKQNRDAAAEIIRRTNELEIREEDAAYIRFVSDVRQIEALIDDAAKAAGESDEDLFLEYAGEARALTVRHDESRYYQIREQAGKLRHDLLALVDTMPMSPALAEWIRNDPPINSTEQLFHRERKWSAQLVRSQAAAEAINVVFDQLATCSELDAEELPVAYRSMKVRWRTEAEFKDVRGILPKMYPLLEFNAKNRALQSALRERARLIAAE